jgi:uncharacterized protein YbjT (DUF2867 family)
MKIIVTGSLGHISRPLTEELLQRGHEVTVISSNAEKKQEIEALGATAAIGSLEDVGFLTTAFSTADALYSMIPPNNYFDHELDLTAYCHRIGSNYAAAVRQSGIKRLVHLSSIGAHLEKGSGVILPHHDVEGILDKLSDVDITFMRPTSFFYNLYGYLPLIKSAGFIAANYGGEDLIPWVSPKDIAAAIVSEFEMPPVHRKVRYVVSDERTANETARILGEAIGKPELKWMLISDKETLDGLVAAGMNPKIAEGIVELYAGIHTGVLAEDYQRNKPISIGKVKLGDFAQEFAVAFNS